MEMCIIYECKNLHAHIIVFVSLKKNWTLILPFNSIIFP